MLLTTNPLPTPVTIRMGLWLLPSQTTSVVWLRKVRRLFLLTFPSIRVLGSKARLLLTPSQHGDCSPLPGIQTPTNSMGLAVGSWKPCYSEDNTLPSLASLNLNPVIVHLASMGAEEGAGPSLSCGSLLVCLGWAQLRGHPHPGVCVRGQLGLCSWVARCMLVDRGSASSVSNQIKGRGPDQGHAERTRMDRC